MRIALLTTAFLALASAARADMIVTISAADFALGTNVTEAVTGVTLQHLTSARDGTAWRIDSSDVFIEEVRHDAPYSLVGFGGTLNVGEYDLCRRTLSAFGCADFRSALEVAFDTPTDFVSVVGIIPSGWAVLEIYSVTGERLQECETGVQQGSSSNGCFFAATSLSVANSEVTLSFQSDSDNIGRVVYGGDVTFADPTVIRYGVPEPSTLLLSGVGLLLFRGRRWARTNRPLVASDAGAA